MDFDRDVKPIFAKHCISCHGPDKQKNGLRLDRKADALAGGESGKVIAPGKSADSIVMKLITTDDADMRMPPKKPRLTSAEIATLQAWIEQGAKWPDDGSAAANPADWWRIDSNPSTSSRQTRVPRSCLWPAACSRPSPSPKDTRTRSPTRSATRSSTRCSPQDPASRVAVETLIMTGQVHVAGEVTTEAYADIPTIVRDRILEIGYDSSRKGFDGESCGVSVSIGAQSADIAQGVDTAYETRVEGAEDAIAAQGAGDQGLMFGFACDETPELMPLPIALAHRLAERLTEVRKDGTVPYLRPDGKTQVTIEYVDGKPVRLDTVVVSSQHAEDIDLDTLLKPDIEEHVVRPVIAALDLDTEGYRLLVNPTGRFVIGGPMGDAGLTGRKIIVDTYGGYARHGGGAFSGKDPSKVDRSAAYAMRWVAKNVVAAGLATRCEVQVAYAIGKAEPVGLFVETFGTETVDAGQDRGRRQPGVRPAPGRDHPRPRPEAADLRPDRGLRPLRSRAARLHLGAHRPRRAAGQARQRLIRRTARDRARLVRCARGPLRSRRASTAALAAAEPSPAAGRTAA